VTLATLKLPVATRSFTLTAWVRDNGVAQGALQPLVRKLLATDPIHSCWAWYYPSVFKYGAHDYHSVLQHALQSTLQHTLQHTATHTATQGHMISTWFSL